MSLPTDHIFISYSRRDDEIMRRVAFFLRDQGFKVWVDNEKLVPGTAAWEESIEDAIKNAFVIIVILSPDSKSSEWVRREITYSDQFQKRVFPILVKGTEEASLPLRLVTRQYVDFRKDEEAGLKSLLAAITFYVDQKKTLEMQRPAKSHDTENPSTDPQISNKRPSNNRMLFAGIFAVLCILGIGIVWAGSRIIPPLLIPETGSDETFPTDIPTEGTDPTSVETSPPELQSFPNFDIPQQYLDGIEILVADPFDDPSGDGWDFAEGTIHDGILEITGNDDWRGVSHTRRLQPGEGMITEFLFSDGSLFELLIEDGEYNTDSYNRFGVYLDQGLARLNEFVNGTDIGGADLSGDWTFQPDTTYSCLIAILPDNEFLMVMWNPENPSESLSYREPFDSSWSEASWTVSLHANQGVIQFDNFTLIQFSGAK